MGTTDWVITGEGTKYRIVVDGEKLMQIHLSLENGKGVARHQHPHEQISFIVSGRVQFKIADQVTEAGVGQSVLFPSNVPHEVVALEPSLILESFTPPRDDLRR